MKVVLSRQDKPHDPRTVLVNSKALRRRTEHEIMNYNTSHFYNEHDRTPYGSEGRMYIKQICGTIIIEKSIYYNGDGSEIE